MPGKHAPKSPRSFYLSLARAGAGVVGAIALVVVLAVVALGSRGTKAPVASSTTSPTPTPSVSSPPLDSGTPSPTPTARAPSTINVAILNGTSRSGLASRTRPQIAAAGYKVVRIGNTSNLAKSTVFYAPGYVLEAQALQQRFPAFTVIKAADASIPAGANLTLVLGADYPS